MSPSNRRPASLAAWWPTSRRRSRTGVPTSPTSAATPKTPSCSIVRQSRKSTQTNASCHLRLGSTRARSRSSRGEFGDAEQALRSSVAELRAEGFVYPALRACELLGFVQRARGDLDAAAETYRWALEISRAPDGRGLPAAGIAHVGLAQIAYQRDELGIALEYATEGVALCRQLDTALTAAAGPMTYSRPVAAGLATLARDSTR